MIGRFVLLKESLQLIKFVINIPYFALVEREQNKTSYIIPGKKSTEIMKFIVQDMSEKAKKNS